MTHKDNFGTLGNLVFANVNKRNKNVKLLQASSMIKLRCSYQNYEWGKQGPASRVFTLISSIHPEKALPRDQPYAELWMGTHAKGPSTIDSGDQQPLANWLAEHPDLAGESLIPLIDHDHNVLNLPFLFKVLSVNKALSIQVHPHSNEAKLLHEADPKNYPDPNHKPEMAIALTSFELLCNIPELVELCHYSNVEKFQEQFRCGVCTDMLKNSLKACFTALMNQSSDSVQKQFDRLMERAKGLLLNNAEAVLGTVSISLLTRLSSSYPGDVGCWAPFFFNHFTLQPGEATLCNMLTYRSVEVEKVKLIGKVDSEDLFLTIYDPPVKEFCVHKIEVKHIGEYNLLSLTVCSILLVLEGQASFASGKLTSGFAALVPANLNITLSVLQSPFIAFRAFCKL
ncbi:Mannose-6-phosphate isomerase [Trichinella patagoniensis]|uniref:mannose-6-phosphate isomerase n=1 Tax=Trichinella patagoniensis TaxID=990121 RepID=A0A0V0ZM16_9BILA|nr:Mannose-6-phosphate isomerase [Trichinella patagoniensis]